MPSYIGKIIVFFTILYTLLIPSTIMNAFAEGYVTNEKTIKSNIDNADTQVTESSKKFLTPEADKKGGTGNTSHTSEYEHADAIGRNIQMAGNILSSSSSELAEQAKSYALGKVNSTISSEAQKWLSQSSTARINFGFDRKGRLENNSIDLLLPIYDNQAAWLFFSQLGYRNKDSRNTVNLGLGGRYFSPNWMYGLNTFYDYDITGKNRRVGLGGELWGDYIKFSTNGYYRLSDWQISRNFEEHHERPANGYDINGEFFLSAYPNLGGRFSYEQYFGDNVTLFNRKTKQKNPSLAKMGVTYTPIPLITMGVDYKQGERGQSETQFLTNFNLRFGVPLSAQLSPDNVASMRTLAGSRYDLVERNNNIVLEHRKVPVAKFSIPKTIVGYSDGIFDIPVKFLTDAPVKDLHWTITGNREEAFKNGGGKLAYKSGNIQLTFPKYLTEGNQDTNNSYTVFVAFELTDKEKTKAEQIQVIVKPFMIQKKEGSSPNYTPSGPLPASGEAGYTFDPEITFDTSNNLQLVKNITFNKVKWLTEPPFDNKNKLKFHPDNEFNQVKVDGNGHLLKKDHVILTSDEYVGDVKVYLIMDGQPKKLVNTVTFNKENIKLDRNPKSNNASVYESYMYTVTVTDGNGNPIQGQKVEWEFKIKNGTGVKFISQDEKTGEDGKANAKLTSTDKAEGVVVSIMTNGQTRLDKEGVNFDWPIINKPTFDPFILNNKNDTVPPGGSYALISTVSDIDGKPYMEPETQFEWSITEPENQGKLGLSLSPPSGAVKVDSEGKLRVKLQSAEDKPAITGITVCVNIVNVPESKKCIDNINFIDNPKNYYVKSFEVFPKEGDITADGQQHYQYTALIANKQDNDSLVKKKTISGVKWTKDKDVKGLILSGMDGDVQTDENGQLTATLTSTQAIKDVMVSLSIENQEKVNAKRAVSFKPMQIKIESDPKEKQLVYKEYIYTVTATTLDNKPEIGKYVKWSLKENNKNIKLEPISIKTGEYGQATAKLKSLNSTPVSNIIVMASIDETTKSAVPVDFVWPIIKSVKVIDNGSVTPGNNYKIIATILDENENKYSGDKINFTWSLETKNSGLSLDPLQEKLVSDGKLETTLKSIKGETLPNVSSVVCLTIDGSNKSQKKNQCTEPIVFKSPPLAIESLEVGIYDSDGKFTTSIPESLIANGKNAYIYQAKILQGNMPLKNHEFNFSDGEGWSRNYENISSDLGLDYPEQDSKHPNNFNKTDEDGYLYASLKSTVGIDGVNVKLNIGGGISKTSNNVDFSPEAKQAKLYLFNNVVPSINSDNTNINLSGSYPINTFSTLSAYLKDSDGENIIKSNENSIKFLSNNSNVASIDNAGEISFGNDPNRNNNVGKAKLSAIITNKNGIKKSYFYNVDVKRYFYLDPNVQGYQYNSYNNCETHNLVTPDLYDIVDDASEKPLTLMTEFPTLSEWNLIPSGDRDIGTLIFYVLDGGVHESFNSTSNSTVSDVGGYILCMIK
ncbi:inverse autotransporter beta domain-containing protein [Xenorhabdus bharatensis]|uniref:inverse autotransporter beta domain-containing protein n=1 Tax=Xenorhabdus bharatensis TaxID=3136256 RepID=UPI0030F37C01